MLKLHVALKQNMQLPYVKQLKIYPPEESWMDYTCRLGQLSKSSTALESSDPWWTVGLSYSQAVETSFFLSFLYFFPFTLFLLAFFLFLVLFQSYCSHVQVSVRTLVHEFYIFYSHTEQNLVSLLCKNSSQFWKQRAVKLNLYSKL